ncbi:uncharacterized protein ATC70_013413 [Mucor velutinosus]|uniref:Arrestin-like N-terminal domain-containing protein n=1 Tax=Mucor velutinosus TaxID=708070 RepID=A0AAN7DAL6_9FUNG|nr:hypothetical protein ATC70_013413 [Mucor velutinosus]
MSSSSNHSSSRHRPSLSSSSIPMPPPESHSPTHPTHLNPPQDLLSVNRPMSMSERRNSQSQLSSSAPSFGSFLNGQNPVHNDQSSNRSSTSSNRQDSRRNSTAQRRESVANSHSSMLTIEFDGGNHVIVRPNRIVRGKVVLNLCERIHVMRIRIKFRAEEAAMVKVDEGGADGKGEWVHEMITTYFETEWKLHGQEVSPYSQCAWDEIEPGHYEYPFALKFPNVNYPPSMEEPAGFGIRYIWTAQADGPALQSGLKSREYITPYRPIIVSIADKEWVYKTTLMKDKKQALAEVQAKLYKQTYCPDEPFKMQLNMMILHSDSKITSLVYRFRKHHEGKMLVQQGTAFRENIRTVIQDAVTLPSTSDLTQLSETIKFDVPTRLVSPSFLSRHTRVHYDLCFQVTIEQGHLFKTSHVNEFAIPITIANLPYDQLLRIPDLTAIQHYRQSTECPLFFDPELEEPPAPQGLPSELIGPLTAALTSPNSSEEQPPSYFSLPELPPQFELRKERKERTVFMTRQARGAYHGQELGEATIIPGLFDEDW